MKQALTHLLLLIILIMQSVIAAAVQPDEILSDPQLEERARIISKGLRCVVCQNQSIDDSDAPLARDMRLLVRDRLLQGDSNEQVRDYLVQRYGNFVLLNPPVQKNTLFLWFGPVLFILLAFIGFAIYLRKMNKVGWTDNKELSHEERERLVKLQHKE
jgi:cytochrome c-type biogenesis protein CcmH